MTTVTLTYRVTDSNTPTATAALTFMVRVDANVPLAPTGVSAVAGDTTITVSWTEVPDTDAGGSDITTYTATATGDGSTETCTATGDTATSCTITGLTNRIEYSVTVVATNAIGDSTPSNVAMATPVAPLTFDRTITDQVYTVRQDVSLDLPGVTGGLGTLSYTLTPEANIPTGLEFTTTTATNMLTGTPNTAMTTVTLTYRVTDSNTPTATAALTFMVRVDANVPLAPTGVSAVAGDTTITVSWTEVPDTDAGGSDITTYTATATGDGSTETCTATGDTATSCTITGLTNRIEYSVTVVATNAIGDSTPSNVAMATPVAPLTFDRTITDQVYTVRQDVSLDLPGVTGGLGTLSYTLTPEANIPTGLEFTTDTATATNMLTGTPNTAMTTVTLTYRVTDSNTPTATAALTFMVRVDANVPLAPTGVSAVAGDTTITVSWTEVPDTDAGGSDITTYTATATGDGSTETCTATGDTATSCTITGLTNRIEYSVTVVATNAIGDSTPSNVAMATPVAPLTFDRTITDQVYTVRQDVSLDLPGVTGGLGTLSYTLTPKRNIPAGLTFTTATDTTTPTLTGTPNTAMTTVTLTYRVTDSNTPTATAALTFMVRVDANVPLAPTGVSAVAGDTTITVSWTEVPDTDAGGSDITTYTATATGDGSTETCTATGDTATSCTITGLTNRIEYSVTVVATNAIGDSTPSNVAMATPVAPLTFDRTITDQVYTVRQDVSLDLPGVTGGLGTLSYTLTPKRNIPAGLTFTTATDTTTPTLTGTPNTAMTTVTLTYRVTDSNTPTATAALTFMVRVDANVPLAPTGVSAVAGDTTITVSWTEVPDTDAGGSDITTYTATATGDGSTETCTATGDTATSCTITGLTNRIEYSVTVVATNAIGDSTPSNVVMATPVAPLTFGTTSIENQVYTVDKPIPVMILPLAADGTGTGDLSYALTTILPTGLTFTTATRTLAGTPTMIAGPVTLTYTVTDSADSPVTVELTFMVRVIAAALLFRIKVFLEGAQYRRPYCLYNQSYGINNNWHVLLDGYRRPNWASLQSIVWYK